MTTATSPRDFGTEVCEECGESVAFGSGRFVNRVVDLDDYDERVERGVPCPEGGWICEECYLKADEELGVARA